jgi:hypothetical protein
VIDGDGRRLGLKVLAASDDEASSQFVQIAASLGVPRADLDVERPDGWPVTALCGLRSEA